MVLIQICCVVMVLTCVYLGISGGIACIWFVCWSLLISQTPASDPRISMEEKEYIESTVGRKEVGTSEETYLMIILG